MWATEQIGFSNGRFSHFSADFSLAPLGGTGERVAIPKIKPTKPSRDLFRGRILTQKALEAKLITENMVEGHVSKSFDQMYVSLKHPRPAVDRFWISLYSLTTKSFVPKILIKFLSRIQLLQRYPGPLVFFASLCNTIKLSLIAAKWFLEGKPVFSTLRTRRKSKKQGSRIV